MSENNNTHENDDINIEKGLSEDSISKNDKNNSPDVDDLLSDVETDYSKYLEENSLYKTDSEQSKDNEVSDNKDEKSNDKEPKKPKKNDDKDTNKKSWWERQHDFWESEGNIGKKIAIIICAILLVLLLVLGGYLINRLSMLKTNDDDNKPTAPVKDRIYDEFDFDSMNDITDAKSLNEMLKKWATNDGQLMTSKNVLNFLLIGVDSESNLSDSMMILSLDKKNKQIKLASVYRDCYIYMQPEGKKSRFSKLNSSFVYGGPQCVKDTIEKNFKVKIDDYVYVDYSSFPKVIDALGGITLDIKPYEARFLNAEYGYNLKGGRQKLNGEQALWYSRIRHLDSDADISRTKRQRYVISTIIDSCKNASIGQFDNIMKSLFPSVTTSLSKTQVLSLGTQAITKGWLKYDIKQTATPSLDFAKGGFISGQWVWIVDYPGAARELQMYIYGRSNIKLSENRKTAIDLKPTTTKPKVITEKTTQTESSTKSNKDNKDEEKDKKPVAGTVKDEEKNKDDSKSDDKDKTDDSDKSGEKEPAPEKTGDDKKETPPKEPEE